MSETHAVAYRELRGRVRAVVEAADPETIDGPSPATPGWTVHDVLAHMVGVTDDVVAGRLHGIATDPWTEAQVEKRRNSTLLEMLDEWDATGPAFEDMLGEAPPEIAGQALFDATTHEHDIRCALAQPGARDSDALDLAFAWITAMRSVTGLPTLRLLTEHGDELFGADPPQATVKTSRFEFLRACTGRRSESEIAAWGWDGDPRPDLVVTADIFTMRPEPLNE